MGRAIRSKDSPASSRRIGKHVKVETKPVASLLPKKWRVSSSAMSRKGKEVLCVKTPFDRVGCRTEEASVAYQQNFSIRLPKGNFQYYNTHMIDKSVIEREMHVEKSDRNHVMDMKNLVMMGLVFVEVGRRWVDKGPNKDQSGEGDGDREDVSDDEDEESGEVDPVPILDSEVQVIESAAIESLEERDYEQSENLDSVNTPPAKEVNTPPAEDKNNEVVDSIIEEVVKDLMKHGYGHCDSIEGREANTPPVERVGKVNVESTQNETKLFPTYTMVQQINGAISKIGGDVGAGMHTVHKDMSTLLKKASELGKKAETSKKMMKEFIDRLDRWWKNAIGL
ncbi:hypothetical protein Scep_004064 [Stephania cephalantha]|uniref:Uncharacterized protein n=1 Tax=Stephania cephalantha TaxID=152367 RepID=A0AAP0KSM9_9MAGN